MHFASLPVHSAFLKHFKVYVKSQEKLHFCIWCQKGSVSFKYNGLRPGTRSYVPSACNQVVHRHLSVHWDESGIPVSSRTCQAG